MSSPQTLNSISTFNGDFFDFLAPEDFNYDIETIAHSLSNICRYGGHSSRFYSVAEHSILVSKLVPPEFGLCGLLHDASEAFVGDMPSPLKALCPDYRRIENRVHEAIAQFYDIPYPHPAVVKQVDKALYKTEREVLTSVEDRMWHVDVPRAEFVQFHLYSPEQAKEAFLSRYWALLHEYRRVA